MSRPRVLLVHRYYWPDAAPYGHMLRVIGEHLAATGCDVTVFCGPVSYNGATSTPGASGTEETIRVRRVWLPPDDKRRPLLRALSMPLFAVRLLAHLLRNRSAYDVMTVSTIPPIVMGLAARVARRATGLPFIYHCMDLYPEVLTVSGARPPRSVIRMAQRLDADSCQAAAAVIVLSEDMRETLVRRGLKDSNVAVLNNFAIGDGEPATDREHFWSATSEYRIIFAGNMSRFQGLEDVINAAQTVVSQTPTTELLLMGSGANLAALQERVANGPTAAVRFVGQQSPATAAVALERSDLAIVSLQAGMVRVAYPSKTATCLAAGCRLLAVVEADSDLGRLVIDNDLGTVSPPGDVAAIADALTIEIHRGAVSHAERDRIRAIGEKHFGRPSRLDQWSRLITQHHRTNRD